MSLCPGADYRRDGSTAYGRYLYCLAIEGMLKSDRNGTSGPPNTGSQRCVIEPT